MKFLTYFLIVAFFSEALLAQDDCFICVTNGPVTNLSKTITEISKTSSCSNGSTTRLFDGVNESRCNQFGVTTYQLGTPPSYRYDEYLTLAGRNFDFTLGFSNVTEKIRAANQTSPPDMFAGYVASNYGGCARTPHSLRQVRRYYCFVFAREIEARTNADEKIKSIFNGKTIESVRSCLQRAGNSLNLKTNCYLTTYDLQPSWISDLERAVIDAHEFSQSTNISVAERSQILSDFRNRLNQFINEWATNSVNFIAALSGANTIARQAALLDHSTNSSSGTCEDRIGALYTVWPDLFKFSTGAPYNKSNDFAYCLNRQNEFDRRSDDRRDRFSRNIIMGIGFAASVAAIPFTAGSSAAIAAGIISGVSGATVGGMTIIEGRERANLIPLHMQAGNIRIAIEGATPEVNAQVQREYQALRSEVNRYYASGAMGIITSAFLAGGGGTMVVRHLSALANQTPQIQALITFFSRVGDSTAARTAMYGLIVGAGTGYATYRMSSSY